MTGFAYSVTCQSCGRPAEYKIAARWSDGMPHELKTYGLVFAACLPAQFGATRRRQAACGLAAGETLEAPSIYRLDVARRDASLQRLPDLEAALSR